MNLSSSLSLSGMKLRSLDTVLHPSKIMIMKQNKIWLKHWGNYHEIWIIIGMLLKDINSLWTCIISTNTTGENSEDIWMSSSVSGSIVQLVLYNHIQTYGVKSWLQPGFHLAGVWPAWLGVFMDLPEKEFNLPGFCFCFCFF